MISGRAGHSHLLGGYTSYVGYAGGGSGHSHNIPYIAVFVWRRTA